MVSAAISMMNDSVINGNLISVIYSDLCINSEEICNIFNHIIIQKDNLDDPFISVLAPQGEL